MKAVLLYLCFCSLAWAQSELQTHYRKGKQRCVGEHQITVKSRHSKHGFYIFNYMYSSSKPNNQTQIKKEDNVHISNPIPDPIPESRGVIDSLTEIAQVTNDKEKHLSETGKDSPKRAPENNQNLIGQHGNIRNWDLDQHPAEFFEDKRRDEFSTGYSTGEIEGSGNHFPDQVDFHHAGPIGNKDHEEDKNYQVMVKEKGIHSETANNNKSINHSDIKIGVKENDARVSPEIEIFLPKKAKDSSIDLLHKGKNDRETSKLASHLYVQSNLSTEVLEKIEPIGTGNNYINISKSSEIKVSNEKSISNATVYKKEGDEYTLIISKLNRPMDTSKISKPHDKVEVNINTISNSQVQEINVNKEHKKDGTTEDVIRGQSNKYMEIAVPSRKHKKDYGIVDIRERLRNQEVNPDKTNKNQVTLKGKLNSLVGRFEVTKPPLKGQVTFLTRISDNGRADPNAKEQSKKSTLKVAFPNEKPKEDVGFTKTFQKELANHEKINRNNDRVSLNDPEVNKKSQKRFGVTFQNIDNKENTNFQVGTGMVAELKRSNTIESSKTKVEYQGEKAVEYKNALSLSHRSHNNIPHVAHIPKNGHLEAQGHFLSTVKKKVPNTGKKSAEVSPGAHKSYAAKPHHRHVILRRKSSQHYKKQPSGKKVHVSDSSQSSESKENSRNDSHQSKDYQNDQLDSYRSSESVEIDLSAERNLSDDHSHMKESMTASQENSKELKSTD
ncbi:uncharacterized protein LOC120316038 [Crotalus tigris]|uniref:uncharacterized protein LOC120316038 n=1 Tax=Crotalus tigris TaxID=88082 RepID=UPI00192F7E63|nr:uncharacterized protein LOC120316038 [Crotalus tigris]